MWRKERKKFTKKKKIKCYGMAVGEKKKRGPDDH